MRILKTQLRYSWYIIIFFIALVAIMITFLPNFRIDPSFSVLVGADSEFNTNERKLANTFGANDFFSILFEIDPDSKITNRIEDMGSPEVRELAQQYAEVFKESEYVLRVTDYELSDDRTYGRIGLQVQVPRTVGSFREVIDDLEQYRKEASSLPGVKTSISGFPILLNRVNNLLVGDNLKALGITLIAIFFVLYWYFKDIRFTLITIAVPSTSLIILGGLMSIFNIPLTITLAAVGILMLGLGVDYTIHVALSYEANIQKGMKKDDAIIAAITYLRKAILASYITTVAGFTALMFGISPSSQSQGLILSIGITIVFVVTMVLMPALVYKFCRRCGLVKNTLIDAFKKKLSKLAYYQAVFPKTVLFMIVILTIVMINGASRVVFSTSNNNWVPEGDPVSEAFRTQSLIFGDQFGSLTMVVESTSGDLRDVQTARDIQKLKGILEGDENVISVTSAYDGLPLDISSLREAFSREPKKSRFNRDYTLTTVGIRVTDFGESESGQSRLLSEIREIVADNPINNAKVSFFGDTIRFNELGQSLQRDTATTTIISFILVFLLASLAYASFRIGFIALLPVLIAIIWAVGLMGYLSVPFTSLSSGLIALVLGIGVDFSVYLVNSTNNYLEKGMNIKKAIKNTINSTGTPIILSSMTTFLGFLSLVFASLLGIQRLGLSLAFSILSVFIVTIVMVPAMLSLGRKKASS
jgi:hypothetical protein